MRFKWRECGTRNENVRKIVISAKRSLERLYGLSHFFSLVHESERDERRRYEIGAVRHCAEFGETSKCILDEVYTFCGIADRESFLFQSWRSIYLRGRSSAALYRGLLRTTVLLPSIFLDMNSKMAYCTSKTFAYRKFT